MSVKANHRKSVLDSRLELKLWAMSPKNALIVVLVILGAASAADSSKGKRYGKVCHKI